MFDCPFCNARIDLGACAIIATNFIVDGETPHFDETGGRSSSELRYATTASGQRLRTGPGGFPTIHQPEPRGFLRRAVAAPVPLLKYARAEDLPTRLCSACDWPLPADAGEREIVTIALVGAQGSGKTHFLASSLKAAYKDQALGPLGFDNFYPVDQSEERFHLDYYEPVFEGRRTLEATQFAADVHRRPLVFRINRGGIETTVLFHDIAGETLGKRQERNRNAAFVHHADALIFMIDPWGLPTVRATLERRYPGFDQIARGFSQTQMLNSIADDINIIDGNRLGDLPTAVAFSKSDLIMDAFGFNMDSFTSGDDSINGRSDELDRISFLIEDQLLPHFGEGALGPAIRRYHKASLHLVAAIGSQPPLGQAVELLRPSRITDPLFSVLERIL